MSQETQPETQPEMAQEMEQDTEQDTEEPPSSSFWMVFVHKFPKPPSVHELVCQIIGNNYPEGLLTDKDGNRLAFSRDLETVDDEMLATIQDALDALDDFIPSMLDEKNITDYKVCSEIFLGYEAPLRDAATSIYIAIMSDGLLPLDQLLWDCYREAGGKKKRQPLGQPSRFTELK